MRPYYQEDYRNKFSIRVLNTRNSLEINGQTSEKLDMLIGKTEASGIYIGETDSNYICAVAYELNVMADNLKP